MWTASRPSSPAAREVSWTAVSRYRASSSYSTSLPMGFPTVVSVFSCAAKFCAAATAFASCAVFCFSRISCRFLAMISSCFVIWAKRSTLWFRCDIIPNAADSVLFHNFLFQQSNSVTNSHTWNYTKSSHHQCWQFYRKLHCQALFSSVQKNFKKYNFLMKVQFKKKF